MRSSSPLDFTVEMNESINVLRGRFLLIGSIYLRNCIFNIAICIKYIFLEWFSKKKSGILF